MCTFVRAVLSHLIMHGKDDHIFVPIHSTDTNVPPGKKSFRRVSMSDSLFRLLLFFFAIKTNFIYISKWNLWMKCKWNLFKKKTLSKLKKKKMFLSSFALWVNFLANVCDFNSFCGSCLWFIWTDKNIVTHIRLVWKKNNHDFYDIDCSVFLINNPCVPDVAKRLLRNQMIKFWIVHIFTIMLLFFCVFFSCSTGTNCRDYSEIS